MNKNSYVVRVLVNGRPVQEFEKDGQTYVEGRIGTEYSVQVKNNHWNRVMAVITVDGVNVITGKPAVDDDNGYVINGYQALNIDGFRKDMSSVGAFKFCKKSNSYCNEKGLAGNNGVIGVRIYNEKQKPITWYGDNTLIGANVSLDLNETSQGPIYRSVNTCYTSSVDSNNNSTNSNNSTKGTYSCSINESSPSMLLGKTKSKSLPKEESPFGVGTTWGEQKQSNVVYVEFERGSLAAEFTLFYASIKGLQKLGVPVKKAVQITHPKAFGVFASPPKGWKG